MSLDETNSQAPVLRMFAQESWAVDLIKTNRRVRDWMNATPRGNAYHCLPLAVANERGWAMTNPVTRQFTWDGGSDASAVKVEVVQENHDRALGGSHFGSGIISFRVPFVFETEPGWTLEVSGAANTDLPGCIVPLVGLVETSWAAVTLTMNWRFLHPSTVIFREGAVLANFDLVPTALPEARLIVDNVESWSRRDRLERWSAGRRRHMSELRAGKIPGGRVWQKEYSQGTGDLQGLHRSSWRYRDLEDERGHG